MTLYTESVADKTDHFTNVFVLKNVACGYDVVTFENTQPTQRNPVQENGHFYVKEAFSVQIGLE